MLWHHSISDGLLSSLLFPPTDDPGHFFLLGVLCPSMAMPWPQAVFLSCSVELSGSPSNARKSKFSVYISSSSSFESIAAQCHSLPPSSLKRRSLCIAAGSVGSNLHF